MEAEDVAPAVDGAACSDPCLLLLLLLLGTDGGIDGRAKEIASAFAIPDDAE